MRVGAVDTPPEKHPFVTDYSTACGVACVTETPDKTNGMELIFKHVGLEILAQDHFEYNLTVMIEKEQNIDDFSTLSKEKQKALMDALKKKLGNEKLTVLYKEVEEKIRTENKLDKQGFSTQTSGEGEGTSFTSPVGSSMLAAAKDAYPELSNDQIITAFLGSAIPVTYLEGDDSEIVLDKDGNFVDFKKGDDKQLLHQKNGHGFLFNATHSGFGKTNWGEMQSYLKEMSDYIKAHPESKTEHATVHSKNTTKKDGTWHVDIDEDVCCTKVTIDLEFKDNIRGDLFLISPEGTKIPLGISNEYGDTGDAIASSFLFQCESGKGTWDLSCEDPKIELEIAKITIHGTKRDKDKGILDAREMIPIPKRYLDERFMASTEKKTTISSVLQEANPDTKKMLQSIRDSIKATSSNTPDNTTNLSKAGVTKDNDAMLKGITLKEIEGQLGQLPKQDANEQKQNEKGLEK